MSARSCFSVKSATLIKPVRLLFPMQPVSSCMLIKTARSRKRHSLDRWNQHLGISLNLGHVEPMTTHRVPADKKEAASLRINTFHSLCSSRDTATIRPVLSLCAFVHARLQVRVPHAGHLYLDSSLWQFSQSLSSRPLSTDRLASAAIATLQFGAQWEHYAFASLPLIQALSVVVGIELGKSQERAIAS